jgi:hypothetical protein
LKPTELKTRKCKICKGEYVPWRTTQPTCGKYDCNVEYAIKHHEKVTRLREKRERQALREAKERIKTRSQWLKEVQVVFNRYIRIRDESLACISCSRHHRGQYHAGHYLSVGARPELRFEESNVHKQCAPCNDHLSGNIALYRIALVKKIGLEQVEWLEGPHEAKHYTIDELKELKKLYQRKCKELLTKES